MEVSRNIHGGLTEHPRRSHGTSMEVSRNIHGGLTEHPRRSHGTSTEVSRNIHGGLTEHPWRSHGTSMEVSRNIHGGLTEHPWRSHGTSMEVSRNIHGSRREDLWTIRQRLRACGGRRASPWLQSPLRWPDLPGLSSLHASQPRPAGRPGARQAGCARGSPQPQRGEALGWNRPWGSGPGSPSSSTETMEDHCPMLAFAPNVKDGHQAILHGFAGCISRCFNRDAPGRLPGTRVSHRREEAEEHQTAHQGEQAIPSHEGHRHLFQLELDRGCFHLPAPVAYLPDEVVPLPGHHVEDGGKAPVAVL